MLSFHAINQIIKHIKYKLMLDKINDKIRIDFENEAKKTIKTEIGKYKKKYPFVGFIKSGMGTVSVSDRDNIILHETNWKEVKKQSKKSNLSESAIFDKLEKQRELADNDEFICFLTNIQTHSIGFCAVDMVL